MSILDAELEDELVEAYIDEVRDSQGFQKFNPDESDIAEALHERPGEMSTTSSRVIIWHAETGEMRSIPRVYLRNTLRLRQNGKRVFSLRPTVKPFQGQVMCLLHPEHPDKAKWVALGINDTCGSANGKPAAHIASEMDLELHMAHKHGNAWKRMKGIEDRRREDEDRARQLEFMDRLTRNAAVAPAEPQEAPVIYRCGSCPRFFDSPQGLALHEGKGHK